jgi:hypothetical protein
MTSRATPRRPKTRRASAGLTPLQLETVAAIARERGLDLAHGWAKDRPYCAALLDHLAIDRRRRPLAEVARFVNNVTREVECGSLACELARKYELPLAFAETMHAYALKQLGYRGAAEWRSDVDLLNAAVAEEDSLA